MERSVDEAREALERGRLKRALRLAWDAGLESVARNDRDGLQRTIDLAEAIRTRSEGGTREQASVLLAYCRHARVNPKPWGSGWAGLRLGNWPRPAPPDAGKVCPECAETVAPAARICRFCGHRFEPDA